MSDNQLTGQGGGYDGGQEEIDQYIKSNSKAECKSVIIIFVIVFHQLNLLLGIVVCNSRITNSMPGIFRRYYTLFISSNSILFVCYGIVLQWKCV